MVEQIANSPYNENNYDSYPELAPDPIDPGKIVDIDNYRKHLDRVETRRVIARAALSFWKETKFLPAPLITKKHEGGDTTVIFSQSEIGLFGDMHATHTLQGWSGVPETQRIIAVRHDRDSDIAEANYIHPRNRRFLLSDLRRQPPDYGSEELQLLTGPLESELSKKYENK